MSLVVVGSVAYDSIETPFGAREDALGGSATYFSIAASAFAEASLVAVVGEDFRDADRAVFRGRRIDTSGLLTAAGKTFRWGGRYHDDMNGRDTLFTDLNVFERFEPKLSAAQQAAGFLFLGNIQPSLQQHVLEQVQSPRFVAADTMNLWIEHHRESLLGVLDHVDALFLNDEEARLLTGKHSVRLAAIAIQEMGPELVIIKRGEHGAIVFNEDDIFYVPAYPLERVVDPTGAGDTFAGGFMGALAASEDLTPDNVRRAAVVGSLMASFCVEGYGIDRLRAIEMAAVKQRYEAYVDLTRFAPLEL